MAAYDYLRGVGLAHTQKNVAERMGATAPNVSSALRGVNSVLTDGFMERFNNAYGGVFSIRWLLTGEGEMLEREPRKVGGLFALPL